MTTVEIVDAASAATLPATRATASRLAYLTALVRDGARHFVDNADVEVCVLCVDGAAFPLVRAAGRPGNAEICSPRTHYVRYLPEARARRHPAVPAACFEALALPMDLVARVGRFDDVVYVNNWLWSTNPRAALSTMQVAAVTARLVAAYPEAAIVFRSLTAELDPATWEAVRANGYRLIRSHEAFLIDTTEGAHLAHANTRRDLALLTRSAYQVVRDPAVLVPHAARIAALYRGLYLDKHSTLNAQLNARFFELTLTSGVFEHAALVADGRVDGFAAYFAEDGVAASASVGYDRTLPRDRGLYRMAIALMIAAAAERGVPLHLGAGAGSFKQLRGARAVTEYDAVYDAHLPRHRRLAWATLALAANRHDHRAASPERSAASPGRRAASH